MRNDLRSALRMLVKNPGFTIAAVLTMAIGIGLNSAVFSVVNAVLFRPLPVEAPEELVNVYTVTPNEFLSHLPWAYPDFEDLRAQNASFSDVMAYSFTPVALEHAGESELIFAETVTGNYFDALGVRPVVGRAFTADDDRRGEARQVAVLSHASWQRRFGGDPGVVGADVRLNGRVFTVLGVAPEGFNGLMRGLAPELWLPFENIRSFDLALAGVNIQDDDAGPQLNRLDDRARRWHWVSARLAPGVTPEQAAAEVATLGVRLAQEYPDSNEDRAFTALPASSVRVMPGVDQVLYTASFVVMGLVALVLLIACANLANMLLARTLSRRKEIATRLALGASRGRIARQLLVEGLALALLGGALGLALALASNKALGVLELPLPVQLVLDLAVDVRVVAFTFAMAALTAVVFGMAPAREATRADLAAALHEDARGSIGSVGRRRLRNALVVAQVALSLLLLICAGLSVRSARNAHSIDPGFNPAGVATAQFSPSLQGYDRARTEDFYRRLAERLEGQPGVRSVSYAASLPLTFEIRIEGVAAEGKDAAPTEEWPVVDVGDVAPGYFETLGIPVLRGRGFSEHDTADAPGVAVVNETLAARFWPGEEALGKRLRVDGEEPYFEVVGVARDGKYRTLGEDPRPYLYRPVAQNFSDRQIVLVRGEGDARALLPSIRQAVRELDDKMAMTGLEPLEQAMSSSLLLPRFGATLFGLFGVIGLLLAAVGLYGVMAYAVSQRTHEIGVRVAMGARRVDVLGMVVRQGLKLTAAGVVLGVAGAAVVTRSLESVLYGVSATDAVTFAGVSLFLVAVALASCYVPARRASRVDPVVALRSE